MSKNSIQNGLLIRRWQNGIQLIKPEQSSLGMPLNQILNLPFNVYIYDKYGSFYKSNEQNALACGFESIKDAEGNTLHAVTLKPIADAILLNNQTVIQEQKMKTVDEVLIQKHDNQLKSAISFKLPFYHTNNKIVGVFGCSIPIIPNDTSALANSLSLLMQTGLFNSPLLSHFNPSAKIYFTKREKDVLHLLTLGKTAKEIAAELHLSRRTVEHHIENAKQKSGVSTRSELIEFLINTSFTTSL